MFRVAIAQFDGATTLRAPPLAAGLLAATLRQEPGLAVAIDVRAARRAPDVAAAALAEADLVGISLYTWNQRYALEVTRRARALRPDLCVVAGGPSVPRRPEASAAFLAAHPWIDALVLGEGERAFVDIVRAVHGGAGLAGLPGVVARDGGGVSLGPPRPRLEGDAFAATGSPYLDGTFDELAARGEIGPIGTAVLETNRGCPFACTFCDWGQATQSKVHELPEERVTRELTWLAERGVPYLYLVDANFGIRRRDVEITRTIGELARRHAAPRFVFFHLTKNATTRNLRTVETLREHGVATQVALSMQDFDADVLLAIKRDNIRPSDALDLRERCHAQGLPTLNELMLGLPAQTAASIRTSIAAAITPFPQDSFFLYPTRVLDNAELAEPAYRARHGIETRRVPTWPPDPGDDPYVVEDEELVVATRTLPLAAWCDAHAFGYLLSALWNQRVLQTTLHVLQFVLGIGAAALVDALLAAPGPRLAAIRAELARFSAAVVDGRATTLPVDGWGPRRREPLDGACARILDDPAGFYAEAAEIAAALAGDAAALVRDAVAWDAVALPSTAVDLDAVPTTAEFVHDWPAYVAHMGSRPRPDPRRIAVRVIPWPLAVERAARLDAFLALGWAKQPRGQIEPLP
jgi:radical SAM superfamily enzyme YgiQ (UPF0313 family)